MIPRSGLGHAPATALVAAAALAAMSAAGLAADLPAVATSGAASSMAAAPSSIAAPGAVVTPGASGPQATAAPSSPGASASRPASGSPARGRPLDLSAPPINHVLTRSEVSALTADHDSEPAEPTDDVMVESSHYAPPVPLGQLRAIPWALMHPLQAWRIFTPVTDQ